LVWCLHCVCKCPMCVRKRERGVITLALAVTADGAFWNWGRIWEGQLADRLVASSQRVTANSVPGRVQAIR
jgi:hypothetical protein